MVAVGEPGYVADLDEQACRPRRADPVQFHQAGPGRGDEVAELFVGSPPAGIDTLEVADELGGDPAPCLAGDVAWADPCKQSLGLGSGEILLRPARDQLEQQVV